MPLIILHILLPLMLTTATTVYEFTKQTDASAWQVQDDTVMGGRSQGHFEITDRGNGRFHGHVSLENDGGFSSINHTLDEPGTLKDANRFALRVKGDGKTYQFRVMADANQKHSHYAEFDTDGSWQTIELAFTDMSAIFHGEPVDVPNYQGERLAVLDFLISNGKEQDFELLIESIALK